MRSRDWRQRIQDILEASARIERYTRNLTFETFAADDMAVDAVIRNIAVIGEAARQIPPRSAADTRSFLCTKCGACGM